MDDLETPVEIGSTNALADLGIADAATVGTKVELVLCINEAIAELGLTQKAAAERLGTVQPKISALANYRVDGFSVEKLMEFLNALDRTVRIVVEPLDENGPTAKTTVIRSD